MDEEELEEDSAQAEGTGGKRANGTVIPLEEMEEGGRSERQAEPASASATSSASTWSSLRDGTRNFFSLILGPVFVQTFVLTFLGEWGDRSQIATIALAAAHVRYLS